MGESTVKLCIVIVGVRRMAPHEECMNEWISPSINQYLDMAKVVKWYKNDGDLVQRNDMLCNIETEVRVIVWWWLSLFCCCILLHDQKNSVGLPILYPFLQQFLFNRTWHLAWRLMMMRMESCGQLSYVYPQIQKRMLMVDTCCV